MTGSAPVSRWIHEEDFLDLDDREKIIIPRAEQMLMNNFESVNPKPKSKFLTYFDCQLVAQHKRKNSPFLLEKCIEDRRQDYTPRTIRARKKIIKNPNLTFGGPIWADWPWVNSPVTFKITSVQNQQQ